MRKTPGLDNFYYYITFDSSEGKDIFHLKNIIHHKFYTPIYLKDIANILNISMTEFYCFIKDTGLHYYVNPKDLMLHDARELYNILTRLSFNEKFKKRIKEERKYMNNKGMNNV